MRHRKARLIAVLFALGTAASVAGCGMDTSRILSPEGCTNKAKVDADLHVDPNDARWIWATDRQSGATISLRLGGGWGVSTDPPAILDPGGRSIAKTGDRVISGCRDIIQDALMIDQTDIVTLDGSTS